MKRYVAPEEGLSLELKGTSKKTRWKGRSLAKANEQVRSKRIKNAMENGKKS